MGFLGKLVKSNPSSGTDDAMTLAMQIKATAEDVSRGGHLYDGPTSSTALDANKFPGAASPGVNTVGDWFAAHNGANALSQFDGSAIFLDTSDWDRITGPMVTISGDVKPYGYGTLMHELLHKKAVGGGFTHDQIDQALTSAGIAPTDFTTGRNRESDQIGKLCF
jgi:hypothetical protein